MLLCQRCFAIVKVLLKKVTYLLYVLCVVGLNLFCMCLQKRLIMSDSVSENDTNCDADDVPATVAVETSQELTANSAVTSMDEEENGSDSGESETEDDDESDEEESGSSDDGDDDDDDDNGDGGGEEDEDGDSDSGNNTNGHFMLSPVHTTRVPVAERGCRPGQTSLLQLAAPLRNQISS